MAIAHLSVTPATASFSDYSASNKHCVFHCGDSWFSVPAISVREVVMAPELVPVPNCHPALAGLGRLRSEFVPVIRLGSILNIEQSEDSSANDCLLVFDGSCTWSLLISESAALESMETIVSQEPRSENTNNVVMGTAMFRDRIVRVLNPNGLLVATQQTLEQFWVSPPG